MNTEVNALKLRLKTLQKITLHIKMHLQYIQ